MSAQPKHSGSWEDQAFFRECALAFLPPRHARYARELSDFFFETVLEFGAGSTAADLVAAVARDLEVSRQVLDGLSRDAYPGPDGIAAWLHALEQVRLSLVLSVARMREDEPPRPDPEHPEVVARTLYGISRELKAVRRELGHLAQQRLVTARLPFDLQQVVRDLEVMEGNLYAAGSWIERPKGDGE